MEWLSIGIKLGAILALGLAIHVVLRPFFGPRKIQPGDVDGVALRHDVKYALSTVAVWSMVGALGAWLFDHGELRIGLDWPSPLRLVAEAGLLVFLFDVYFYTMHRLLHTDWLYRRVHAVHHRSTAPSVVTSIAFHPVEALLLVAYFPLVSWLLPIHAASLAVATTILSASIVLAHCGHEIFPAAWHRTPVLRWYVTPLIHDLHHSRMRCNYGATLSLLDRWLGTFETDESFLTASEQAAVARRNAARAASPGGD